MMYNQIRRLLKEIVFDNKNHNEKKPLTKKKEMKKRVLSLLLTSCFLASFAFAGCKSSASNSGEDPSKPGPGGSEIVTPGGDITEPGSGDITEPGGGNTTEPGDEDKPSTDPTEVKPGDITEVEPVDPSTQSEESKKFDEELKSAILGLNYMADIWFYLNNEEDHAIYIISLKDRVQIEDYNCKTREETKEIKIYTEGKEYTYDCDDKKDPNSLGFTFKEVKNNNRSTENYLTEYVEDICLLQVLLGRFDDFSREYDPTFGGLKYGSPETYRYVETYEKNGKEYYNYNLLFHDVKIYYDYGKLSQIRLKIDDLLSPWYSYEIHFYAFGKSFFEITPSLRYVHEEAMKKY